MAKLSFRIKLISSYFLLVLISLGFIFFFLDRSLKQRTFREISQSLTNQVLILESRISSIPKPLNKPDYLDSLSKELAGKIGARITVIGIDGKVLADSDVVREALPSLENHLYKRPEVSEALDGRIGQDVRYSTTLRIDMLYLALPLKEDGSITGIIRMALPLTGVQEIHLAARKIILTGLLISLLLACVMVFLITKGLIRPVNRIIAASLNFSKGDFSHRILQDSNDEIDELAGVLNKMAQDIEDKIREISTKGQHLEAIFNSMIEGVIVIDKTGLVVSINHAVEEIFNITRGQTEGKPFLEAVRNNEIFEIIQNILKKGRFFSKEITLNFPVQRVFEINATPIFKDAAVNGALVVIHDITEIRRLETIRRDFVANVSHELKTPLTSIKGFIETLLEGALEDKENNRNFLKIIQTHADRLDTLVNDLLSLSHLESEGIEIRKTDFDLDSQIKDVLKGFKSQLKPKNIEIINELPSGFNINADKDRIHQVLINLIDNAIKFNKEHGFIKIYSELADKNLKIVVEDSGIGIPQRDIPRIFERFYRVDKARSRELGGTGLGLSIVKHIIELHNGAVGVESTEGLGSKFWFTLSKLSK